MMVNSTFQGKSLLLTTKVVATASSSNTTTGSGSQAGVLVKMVVILKWKICQSNLFYTYQDPQLDYNDFFSNTNYVSTVTFYPRLKSAYVHFHFYIPLAFIHL
jgi:hypothetical protein